MTLEQTVKPGFLNNARRRWTLWLWIVWTGQVLCCGNRQDVTPPQVSPPRRSMAVDSAAQKVSKMNRDIFEAQVAGQFYTSDPLELQTQIGQFLHDAQSDGLPESLQNRDLVGVLCPHAGYVYSGPVAGYAFAAITAVSAQYATVVVMALSHRHASTTVSLLDMDAYRTPLGELDIDRDGISQLLKGYPGLFSADAAMFRKEHSLEVELPFIQVALPRVSIIPMIVAVSDEALLQRVGEALFDTFGKSDDVLFVVSSDLSHFYPYDEAKGYDTVSLSLIESWSLAKWRSHASQSRSGMCGVNPMFAFAKMFEQYDVSLRQVTRLKYLNSGDTAGDKSQVVGYGALAFSVQKGVRSPKTRVTEFGPYTPEVRRELMQMAKTAVRRAAEGDSTPLPMPASQVLRESGAAFVTLKKKGRLRGCIGHVIARLPLYRCIEDVARSAAVRDTRFSPVAVSELDELSYEISILTRPEPIRPEAVVVGRHGLIVSRGRYSGLLLPQVPVEWEWDREQFLSHTCDKAGLPMDCWKDPQTQIEAFQAIVFGEADQ